MATSSPFLKNGSPPRVILVSDLDWTMVDHNDKDHNNLGKFNALWKAQFDKESLLVFSTGRSPQLFQKLAEETPLLDPDILVCSVGTEILLHRQPDVQWEEYLNQGWDREKVCSVAAQFPELKMQDPSEQRTHKVSFKLSVPNPAHLIEGLRRHLSDAKLDTSVIYSGGVDVDILPSRASKGKALSFLLDQVAKITDSNPKVLVCGDSGNDIELFAVPGVLGCMVANAHAELRDWVTQNGDDRVFHATQDGPGGILEAIEHFRL